MYIDNYGNVISNISEKMFQEVGKGRRFKASARRYSFTKIFTKYSEVAGDSEHDSKQYDGSKLAIFNAAGYLEIAIYRSNLDTVGGAATLLGLDSSSEYSQSLLKAEKTALKCSNDGDMYILLGSYAG